MQMSNILTDNLERGLFTIFFGDGLIQISASNNYLQTMTK